MYTSFYNFTGRPFQLSPDPKFYFEGRSHKKAMAYLTYGLNQGEGFIIVTGDIGAGKTMLVGHLLSQLDSGKFVAAKVVTTQIEADDTLRMVASAFGIAQEKRDKATLLREIEAFLAASHALGKRVLLIIDEVQNLPVSSLEELRMLSNFQVDDEPALQCYLLGQPQFRTTLASAELEQLRQRVIASYHLEPLAAEETRSYIQHRLRTVGWTNDPEFTDDAFARIFEETGGVPRRINTLCSRLLLFGVLCECHRIDASVVDEVVKDLAEEVSRVAPDSAAANEDAAASGKAGANGTKPSPPCGKGAPPVKVDLSDLLSRIELLEKYVRAHDHTIRRAFEIAAEHLDNDDTGETRRKSVVTR